MKAIQKQPLFWCILLFNMFFGTTLTSGQNSLSSVRINIDGFTLSKDAKTLSYNIYFQDIDPVNTIAVPGYIFRMSVPASDIGETDKMVWVTNESRELGADFAAISLKNGLFTMKFINKKLILAYDSALILSEEYPGTRIGTFNIRNKDDKPFENPQSFTAIYSGDNITNKSTVTVFIPKKVELAENSTTAFPVTSFYGLGNHMVSISDGISSDFTDIPTGGFTFYPNPADKDLRIRVGKRTTDARIYDLSGKLIMKFPISTECIVPVAGLNGGSYLIEINGIRKKFLKR